jgi:N-acetylmuramoyl-L-alanine amidase
MRFDYSKVFVHLDPGHASSTLGKRSSYLCSGVKPEIELYEWKFNRDIVERITDKLLDLGFNVNNVCPENDIDIKLTERANRANKVKDENPTKKHLFISVHGNAHGDGSSWTSAKGWSIYTTPGQNISDKLAECIYDIAECLFPKMGRTLRRDESDGDKDWESNFTVIQKANMPAVLTENFFYTNVDDCEFMLSEEGMNAIADVHVQGIKSYCELYLS